MRVREVWEHKGGRTILADADIDRAQLQFVVALNKLVVLYVVFVRQPEAHEGVRLLWLMHFERGLRSSDREAGIETPVQILNIFSHGALYATKRDRSLDVT